MAKFQGGLDEIIKALQLMSSNERKRLINDLAQKDPNMAEAIKSRLYNLEDLKYLTPQMLVEFLRSIKINDLALSLRLYSNELCESIIARVSSRMGNEIKDIVNGPKRKVSEVEEAEARVLSTLRNMIEQGKIVISKDDDYV